MRGVAWRGVVVYMHACMQGKLHILHLVVYMVFA